MKIFDVEQIYFYGRKTQRDYADNMFKVCYNCIFLKKCFSKRYGKKCMKYIHCMGNFSYYKEI